MKLNYRTILLPVIVVLFGVQIQVASCSAPIDYSKVNQLSSEKQTLVLEWKKTLEETSRAIPSLPQHMQSKARQVLNSIEDSIRALLNGASENEVLALTQNTQAKLEALRS